ncbi:MAG: hypothetical protein UZ19_OD1000089 [Parcubacteria bacterium OLB19]|nr:MAG: hypothetical protein UZ19_OD1000089 [Parcubacteria bacterium OLB19]
MKNKVFYFNNLNLNLIITSLFTILILIPINANASEAFGAFAPKVSYINSSTTISSGCDSNESSIEFWLVEKKFRNTHK